MSEHLQAKQWGLSERQAGENGENREAPHPFADLETCEPSLMLAESMLIRAAVHGSTVGEASRRAGLSESKGRKMLFRLVEIGVLQARKIDQNQRWHFRHGDAAYAYHRAVEEYLRGIRPPGPKLIQVRWVRVHRSAWSFRLHAPLVRVPWERAWDPNEEGYATDFRMSRNGVGIWMKATRGEPAVLTIEPAERRVFTPSSVERAGESMRIDAVLHAVELLHTFGSSMDGASAKQTAPTEYAIELEGLDPFGRPGVDIVWADRSLGVDRVEIETQRPDLAAAMLAWTYDSDKVTLSELVERTLRAERVA